ncbi:alpha/beta fold hydrolase [Desulfocurvus sp. DL9XJH121]
MGRSFGSHPGTALLACLLLAGLLGCAPSGGGASLELPTERFHFTADGRTLAAPVFSCQPLGSLGGQDPAPHTLLIMLHGHGLTAGSYFRRGQALAAQAPEPGRVLVLAPLFPTRDRRTHEPGTLFWGPDWRSGGQSLSEAENAGLPGVSAFEILDRLILHVLERAPLRRVIVCGHSAGGQLSLRYAFLNRIRADLAARGVALRCVAANPSSYLYLGPGRYAMGPDGAIHQRTAGECAAVPGYDDYKYGLGRRTGYAAEVRDPAARLAGLDLLVLLGEEDVKRGRSLDKRPQADLQGTNRLERGLLYRHHLERLCGGRLPSGVRFALVPGAGHDAGLVFAASGVAGLVFSGP